MYCYRFKQFAVFALPRPRVRKNCWRLWGGVLIVAEDDPDSLRKLPALEDLFALTLVFFE